MRNKSKTVLLASECDKLQVAELSIIIARDLPFRLLWFMSFQIPERNQLVLVSFTFTLQLILQDS